MGVEVGIGGSGIGADEIVVVKAGHPGGKHVFPGILVAAVAGKALLVAVIEHRHAPGEKHQGIGQFCSCQQLGIRTGAPVFQKLAESANIVVAEKFHQLVRRAVGVGVAVILIEQIVITSYSIHYTKLYDGAVARLHGD